MTSLAFHPLANIFPLVEGSEFDELVADIREHGLHEPIVVYEDKILDGRNRLRACVAAGVEPAFMPYTGDDPISYVISLNLRRRHLDESQRAMVAAKLATLKRGDNQHSPIGETSQAKAAELLNVGKRSVERATEVRDHGAPELVSAVEQRKVSVSAAAAIASQSIDEQREILALVEPKLILKAAQAINARKAEKRHAERIAKLAELSKGNTALDTTRRYPVIYADPASQFRQGISSPTPDTENHYPTMTTEAICALPVANLATPDAVMFLWTTTAHLPEALRVMTAWGFEYQTNMVWIKDWIGPGYWVRGRHELLLIGSRGKCRIRRRLPGLILSSRRRAANTAASPTKLTNLSSACIRTCRGSNCSLVTRGPGGRRGETKWKQRQTMAFLVFCAARPALGSEG
jgi:N6-adenosine-specific RNA methylase IME4/ParB-like chromosome segregation protein Spo0J